MGRKGKVAASAVSPDEPQFENPNQDWHVEIQSALDKILGYYGADLEKADALPAEAGFQAPVDMQLVHDRLDSSDWSEPILASGGVNALWASPLTSMTPNVKINQKALKSFMSNFWPEGMVRPLTEPVDFRAVRGRGALQRLSPEEPVQALVLQVASRIEAEASEEELEKWKKCLLSCPGRFVQAESWENQYFWAVNSRRRTSDLSKSVSHLCSQIVSDIWMFKKRREAAHNKTFTAQEIADAYAEHMADTRGDDEPRSDVKIIEKALTVYDKVLSIPSVRSFIEKSEHIHGAKSPWNSITKLIEVHYKCKTAARVEWFFQCTDLALDLGHLEAGDLSINKLKGAAGKIGMADLILFKKSIKDFLIGRFLDVRNFKADKEFMREAFKNQEAYKSNLLHADRTLMSSWSEAASKTLDMIENTCYSFDGGEGSTIKTGIKQGKTAQEIVEEYNPWKTLIEEIDAALAVENKTMKTGEEDAQAATAVATASASAGSAEPQQSKFVLAADEGIDLSTVEEAWSNFVDRQISKYVALIVEKGLSQGQLAKELQRSNLAKIDGSAAGNVCILFDSNLFGEAITAPHIRACPLQNTVVTKMWKALQETRASTEPGILKPGDVVILLDGGRKNVNHMLNCFGLSPKDRGTVDKGRKAKDGRTMSRQIMVFLSEDSVHARKWRKKSKNDPLNCCQIAHVFYNGTTNINARDHKHFPKTSNMSNTLGPISLQPFSMLPKMTVGQKKEFWANRRRACGGRTGEDAEDDEEAGSEEAEDDEEMEDVKEVDGIVVAAVGAGRGSQGVPNDAIQPICFHQLPRIVTDSLVHAFWGLSVIDLSPGAGELCCDTVMSSTGYLGICHSQSQKDFILKRLKKEMLAAMAKPDSKMQLGIRHFVRDFVLVFANVVVKRKHVSHQCYSRFLGVACPCQVLGSLCSDFEAPCWHRGWR